MTPLRHVGRRALPAAAVPSHVPWYARLLGVRPHWAFAHCPPLLDPRAVCDVRVCNWWVRHWSVWAN